MKIKRFEIVMFIILLYFIPKYIEYTTYIQYESVQNSITLLKNTAYILAVLLASFITIKKRVLPLRFLLVIIPLLIYFSYEAMVKDRNAIFVIFILGFNLIEEDFDRYLKVIFRISCGLYVFICFSATVGWIENVGGNAEKYGITIERYSLGFTYSGQCVMMLIPIVFMYYYINRKKISILANIFWIIIDIVIYYYSRTIMGFSLILAFILLFNLTIYMDKKKKINDRYLKKLSYVPYIFFAMTIGGVYLKRINNIFGILVDYICNGRFNLGNIIYDAYGIKLFGTNFQNNMTNYYEILDSEYMHMLIGEGVIYTIIALLLGQCLLLYTVKKKDNYLCLIFVLIFFNAIVNNGIYNVVMNPFSILLIPSIRVLFVNKFGL